MTSIANVLPLSSDLNSCSDTQRAHYPWHHQHHQQQQLYQNPYLHYGRPLLAAASNHNGAYASTGGGHSGYGMEPSVEYEVQQTPPSGSYSSYHPSGGSAPAHPPPLSQHPPHPPHPPYPPPYHAPKSPPTTPPTKKKKSGSSVMSALTLLSFFFFVNMLQSCIKEHISDINPTVMVLTSVGSRNRFNKLAEMNSREQTSSPASTTASESASSWQQQQQQQQQPQQQQPLLVPASSSAVLPVIVTPAVTLHTPYSSGLVTNKPASHTHSYQQSHQQQHYHQNHQQQLQHQQHEQQQQPYHDDADYNNGHRTPSSAADFYPNRTYIDQSLRPDSPNSNSYSNSNSNSDSYSDSDFDYYQHHYYPERERHRHHYMDYAWSSGSVHSRPHLHPQPHPHPQSYSHAAGNKRYSSSASLGAQSGVSSYSDNARYRQTNDDVDDDADDADYDQQRRHHYENANADRSPQRRASDSFYTRNNGK
ncbi:myb-like protein Q [Drosophila mojavensis]|uniref:myb-like protein Q n=1 Tax=Drosophila mojavensis TaxID=7230 RepID=UPI0013EE7456|nr:myb-like protein Q [Drosophila mojavensis]